MVICLYCDRSVEGGYRCGPCSAKIADAFVGGTYTDPRGRAYKLPKRKAPPGWTVEDAVAERVRYVRAREVVDLVAARGGLRGLLDRDPRAEEVLELAAMLPEDCWVGRIPGRIVLLEEFEDPGYVLRLRSVDLITGEERVIEHPGGGFPVEPGRAAAMCWAERREGVDFPPRHASCRSEVAVDLDDVQG